ncbi:MAG TPA: 30S ribosomal protein S6 [Acidimicrobiales bacterium]
MRAYELMIIFDPDLDDAGVQAQQDRVRSGIESAGGRIASADVWGRRRLAYEIDHKHEGYYVVYEVVAGGGALDDLERQLRLADEVVRHKLIRLPDREAARRGLVDGRRAPASAG